MSMPVPPPPVVALLTDFGDRDGFVGVMKGVIQGICANCITIDMAHHIEPQNVNHASWVLNQGFDYMPDGSVIVAVVDPHVGCTNQQSVVLVFDELKKVVVVPDNGLISRLVARCTPSRIRLIENPAYQLVNSHTFHGRDRYAPVGAHLAKARFDDCFDTVFDDLGPSLTLDALTCHSQVAPVLSASEGAPLTITGVIETIDTFGNLMTNCPNEWFDRVQTSQAPLSFSVDTQATSWRVYPCGSYTDLLTVSHKPEKTDKGVATQLERVALLRGSHGCLEFALFGQALSKKLDIQGLEQPTSFVLTQSLF